MVYGLVRVYNHQRVTLSAQTEPLGGNSAGEESGCRLALAGHFH